MKAHYGFPEMYKIIPPGRSFRWEIRHETISEEEAQQRRAMAFNQMSGSYAGLEAGTYVSLYTIDDKGQFRLMMNDTWAERLLNRPLLENAHGNVLILGLGIGMTVAALCQLDRVDSVTVIELDEDVIRLVEPHLRHPKLTVLQGDFYNPRVPDRPVTGRVFDTLWFDIWASTDDMEDWTAITKIVDTWYRHCSRNVNSWCGIWCGDYMSKRAPLREALIQTARDWNDWLREEASLIFPNEGGELT